MIPIETPDFYNDLSLTLQQIEHILADGVTNRRAAAHHPVIATISDEDFPSQRVMILRECNWTHSTLRFHTDMRSQKITQITSRENAAVLVYDGPAKLQIRLTGKMMLGPVDAVEAAWDASTEFARRCYMTQSAPGNVSDAPVSGLPAWIEGKQPTLDMLKEARENFAILLFSFDRIDWLYLANKGHRRARYVLDEQDNSWKGSWLIP